MISSRDLCTFFEILEHSDKAISYAHLSKRDLRSLIFHLLYAAESFYYQSSLNSIVSEFEPRI